MKSNGTCGQTGINEQISAVRQQLSSGHLIRSTLHPRVSKRSRGIEEMERPVQSLMQKNNQMVRAL